MPDPNLNNISPTQKLLQQYLIDAPVNVVKGLLGLDPQKDESKPGYWANFVGQLAGIAPAELLKAGLPFAAIKGGAPVYHGTSSVFEQFDPSKYDKGDILGWMTHFSESPHTASEWASGQWKNRPDPGNMANVIPAKIDAKNVLDLTDPYNLNPDDMSAALAALSPEDRANALAEVRSWGESPTYRKFELRDQLLKAFNNPENFKRSPFDAIRYYDIGSPAFAVPDTTPIKGLWGSDLNTPPKSLKVIRKD